MKGNFLFSSRKTTDFLDILIRRLLIQSHWPKLGQVAQLAAKESERCIFLSEHICPFEQSKVQLGRKTGVKWTPSWPSICGPHRFELFTLIWSRKQLVCAPERPPALFHHPWRQCPVPSTVPGTQQRLDQYLLGRRGGVSREQYFWGFYHEPG